MDVYVCYDTDDNTTDLVFKRIEDARDYCKPFRYLDFVIRHVNENMEEVIH